MARAMRSAPLDGQRAALELVAQAPPVHVLEHEEERAVREAPEVRGGGHVRVVDAPAGDGLALEAREDLRVVEESRRGAP